MSTAWNAPEEIQRAYRAACWLEVSALKPGNVSETSPGHGMTAADFHLSASVTAGILTQPGLSLGESICRAVAMTRRRVGFNTNLGIVLLCAPLARAAGDCGEPRELHERLKRVLAETSRGDSARVFEAIRLANPGGLGSSDKYDVHSPPRVGLRRVMAAAAHRDLIARQYVTDFEDVFAIALPRFRALRVSRKTECCAVTELFLYLLAQYPDSHITRKHGPKKAAEVTRWAAEAHALLASFTGVRARRHLEQLDARLKAEDINPGTTADLTVATLFLDRLLKQYDVNMATTRSVRRADTERMAVRETAFFSSENDERSYQRWQ